MNAVVTHRVPVASYAKLSVARHSSVEAPFVIYVISLTPEEVAHSLRLIAEGQVDAAPLITGRVGIDGVAQAFADLAKPDAHTKILVEPWR